MSTPSSSVPFAPSRTPARPVRGWQVAATVVLAVLSAAVAAVGLLDPGRYPPALRIQLLVQDFLVLVVGVPVLLLAVRSARRGSLRARLVWLGALAYAAYLWLSAGLQVPFSRLFLAYVLLVALALVALVAGAVGTDPRAARRAFDGRLRERLYGGLLVATAVGLAALWLSELIPATITATPPGLVSEVGPQALVSHVLDLAVVVPGLLAAGVLLWRARPWGYVLAGVGLVFGALLAPTITGATVAVLLTGALTVTPAVVVFTVVPLVLATALAVGFLRAMDPLPSPLSTTATTAAESPAELFGTGGSDHAPDRESDVGRESEFDPDTDVGVGPEESPASDRTRPGGGDSEQSL